MAGATMRQRDGERDDEAAAAEDRRRLLEIRGDQASVLAIMM